MWVSTAASANSNMKAGFVSAFLWKMDSEFRISPDLW